MKRFVLCIVVVVAMVYGSVGQVKATELFDNGPFGGSQSGTANSNGFFGTSQTVYDDFLLASDSTITGFEWLQHDPTASYNSTLLTIYNDVPSSGSLITSFNVVATRTPNATGTVFGADGFDYSVDGLSLELPAGTYWLGILNNMTFTVAEVGTSWDQTVGNASTIPGRRVSNSSNPLPGGLLLPFQDSVFKVIGIGAADDAKNLSSRTVNLVCVPGNGVGFCGPDGLRGKLSIHIFKDRPYVNLKVHLPCRRTISGGQFAGPRQFYVFNITLNPPGIPLRAFSFNTECNSKRFFGFVDLPIIADLTDWFTEDLLVQVVLEADDGVDLSIGPTAAVLEGTD